MVARSRRARAGPRSRREALDHFPTAFLRVVVFFAVDFFALEEVAFFLEGDLVVVDFFALRAGASSASVLLLRGGDARLEGLHEVDHLGGGLGLDDLDLLTVDLGLDDVQERLAVLVGELLGSHSAVRFSISCRPSRAPGHAPWR